MNKIFYLYGLMLSLLVFPVGGQTIDAFEQPSQTGKMGLLDPSRFNIGHSVSFGMSSSPNLSGLKSQSLYSTMMTYKFSKPITLDLNFSLPIHSTYSSSGNLTPDNVESLDYFKSIPIDATLSWQPSENFSMRLSIARYAETNNSNFLHNPINSWYASPFRYRK